MLLKKARQNPLFLAIAGVVLVSVLGFAWWTVSPLFIRTTLVEGQYIAVPAANGDMAENGSMGSPTATTAAMGNMEPTPEAMMVTPESMDGNSGMMNEPTAVMEEMAKPTMEAPASMAAPTQESMAVAEPTATMGPVVFASGNFDHKDSIHYADGQAIIARDAEGNNVVRLQDLAAANGPDLYVYVTEHPDPANSDELHMGGYNLGTLKATNGSFSYTLDPAIDVSKIKSVVIYCKAFSVIFSTATLQVAEE